MHPKQQHANVFNHYTKLPGQCKFNFNQLYIKTISNTGLFISPSGISELDCATTKTDTAERSISIGRESLQDFCTLAYFQVPPLGGSCEEKWRSQWIRKHSMSWNLPKLSQLWLCNGGFGSCTTQNHLQTKQFVNGTWIPAEWLPVRFAAHRQLLCWLMYHSRIVLSVDGSVWYMIRNLRCTVTVDSVLANSKT